MIVGIFVIERRKDECSYRQSALVLERDFNAAIDLSLITAHRLR